MAMMRRLLPSTFRRLCSSSSGSGPAQLSGVSNLSQKPAALRSTAGEIGEVSGIPEEHLHRKVNAISFLFRLGFSVSCVDARLFFGYPCIPLLG